MNRVILIPALLLFLIAGVGFYVSAGPIAVNHRQTVVYCTADDINTLDPGKMSWQNDINTAMGLWEGLTADDLTTLKPIPGVAETWEISPDGKTYTFHLRSSAKWSSGEPVTAKDFIFAWKRVLTPSTGADYIGLFRSIVGAEEYTQALSDKKAADFSTVGVQAPDDATLIVHLKQPCTYFLDLCAFPPFYPLNEKAMAPYLNASTPEAGYDGAWTRPPQLVTNGAYVLKEWKFKQRLLLEPNPFYWDRAHVRCEHLLIKSISDPRAALLAYKSGAVDVLNFMPEQFGEELLAERAAGRMPDVHYDGVFGSYYFVFNCTRPPLNDKRVREALALAVDREKMVTEITRMQQRPLGVIVPPDSIPGYVSPAGMQMNLAEAKRLLAEAGYPEGKGMRPLEIMYTTEKALSVKTSQALGAMWEQNLGLHITFRGLERGSFNSERRVAHNFDVCRGGWYGDYTDPTTWLDLSRTGDGNNDGMFSSKPYDDLMNQAAMEPNPTKRFALLSQAEGLLVHDEFPYVPLFQYGDGYIFDEQKIGGLKMNVRMLTLLKWIYRK